MTAKMPEPVAYLIDWPEEPELGIYFSEEENNFASSRPLITTDQAEAYAVARVNEALEALEMADAMLSGANMNAEVVERKVKAAIRALKKEQS